MRKVATNTPNADTSIEACRSALASNLSFSGDPIGVLSSAVDNDDRCALAHIMRATWLLLSGEKRHVVEAICSIRRAERYLDQLDNRERGLLQAARALARGKLSDAAWAFENILIDHPTDAFALQSAHAIDRMLGDSANMRDRIARVLPSWSPHMENYAGVLSMYAFGLQECNNFDQAETSALIALKIQPNNGYALNALGRAMLAQGRSEDAIELFTARQDQWANGSRIARQNWSLFCALQLDLKRLSQALFIYDQQLDPTQTDRVDEWVDAAGLLWRMKLRGVDVQTRFERLAQAWQKRAISERGHNPKADLLAAIVMLNSGMTPIAKRIQQALESNARDPQRARPYSDAAVQAVTALLTYEAGAYEVASTQLWRLRAQVAELLGTWLDSDIIDLALIDAALRAGRYSLAAHIANERVERRPGSAASWDLLTRVSDLQRLATAEDGAAYEANASSATGLDLCKLMLVAQ